MAKLSLHYLDAVAVCGAGVYGFVKLAELNRNLSLVLSFISVMLALKIKLLTLRADNSSHYLVHGTTIILTAIFISA